VAVREILSGTAGTDTALFSGPVADYDIAAVPAANGNLAAITVTHSGGTATDGTDTLRNIEVLQFTDGTVTVAAPAAPVIGSATATSGSATVNFTPPAGTLTGFSIEAVPTAGGTTVTSLVTDGTATSGTVNGLTNGTAYQLRVAATNAFGTGAFSALSNTVTPVAPTPVATLTPTTGRAFANTNVGATTAGQLVTLTNSGNGPLTISSRTLGGTNAVDFVLGPTTCGVTLAAGASCTTSIAFRPTAAGARAATFVVTDNATGSPRSVPLTGTGVAVVNAAPTVTARTPAVNATAIGVGGNITATFSEAVNGVSGTTFQLRNTATNAVIGAVVTRNGTTNQWILNPAANLQANTAYTVTLTGGAAAIRDLQNAPLATTTWSFTTAAAPAAIVAARTPAVNATNVVTNTNVTATFSLNVAGVNGTTFTLRRVSNNTLVGAGVTYNATTRTATLNPNANLVAGVQYRATLTGGAAAIRVAPNGTPLTTTSWTFTTDGTAPTVFTGAGTLTNPLAGATGFSRTANVVTEFSEPMVLGGITATTVRLQRVSTGAIVTAVVTSANLNGRTRAILNPGVTLAANAQYRVLLTGGATALRDLSGNPLATQNRTFTTGA
jgi:hypothetical protein